jgi:hypothetical protein
MMLMDVYHIPLTTYRDWNGDSLPGTRLRRNTNDHLDNIDDKVTPIDHDRSTR